MPTANPPRRRTAGALVLALALPFLGGCEWLTGVNEPDDLRVVIESDDVTQVTLVTSPYFLLVPDPECPDVCERLVELVVADTTTVSLPYDRTYAFTSRQRYFVETWAPGQEATLAMKVWVDDEVWYDNFRLLRIEGDDGAPETLRFVYTFNELTIPN